MHYCQWCKKNALLGSPLAASVEAHPKPRKDDMPLESPQTWPLRPSHSSYVLHGLCMALADLIHEEGGGSLSRRALLKAGGIATAAEVFAGEVADFFGGQAGEYENLLEQLENEFMTEQK